MYISSQSADHRYDTIFRKFRLGLQNWCRTGKEPEAGNQDIKYYLDLQEQRLKKHDLTLNLKFESDDEVLSVHQCSNNVPIIGSGFSRFNKSLYMQNVTRTAVYSRNDKQLL